MDSSSTSSNEKCYEYDVFLSFRGEDTRKNFVDHLYTALERQGIDTYKDDERIEQGKRIDDELMRSIVDSQCYIIVFSKNYASSSWCLDELVKIMECCRTDARTAYPVFYDVEPSDVRKQSRAVGEAFAKHVGEDAAEKWREALKEAADLAGWELKNTVDGREAKFINKIVEKISLELRFVDSDDDEKLIGMEPRIKAIEAYLETGYDDVRMIGIKGIGGGGKTTLARAIFEKISSHFDGTSFVDNVREVSKVSGLQLLQKQVLSDVYKNQSITVNSAHAGKSVMKKKLRGKKVLVVLDDVDHIDQLEALAGAPTWFKRGSRIIITTRDEQVLIAHRLKLIFDVNLLSDEEAMCLFSRYAFGRDAPVQGYEDLSLEVVHYAAGLPLTIKVLGSFLCGKDTLHWNDALDRLKTIPLKETIEKLEISYFGLEDDYKEIFLDVACFLRYKIKDDVIRILESCGFHARNGLKVLEQKSLITVNECGLKIHDHIVEMGWNIVRRSHPDEPNEHTRLSDIEDVEDVLANNLGTEATRCIELFEMQLNPEIVMKGLGNMKKLRYLMVYSIIDDYYSFGDVNIDQVSQYFPNALRYLSWDYYPFRSLPETFQANNLVTLQFKGSKIIQLWEGEERKILKKLRFLDLSDSKLRTLDLGLTPNLEMLHLQKCDDLVELHAPVGCLQRLTYLDLGGNSMFLSLLFTRRLESHEVLSTLELHLIEEPLRYSAKNQITCFYKELTTGKLQKFLSLCVHSYRKLFSQTSYVLQKLRKFKYVGNHIYIIDMTKFLFRANMDDMIVRDWESLEISHPPNGIYMLKHLISLKLICCNVLEKLHEELGHFQCLQKLTLSDTDVKHLPDSICMLKHLVSLKLISCRVLEKVPEDLGNIQCLQKLTISKTKIKNLPDSICMLKHLKSLIVKSCELLEKLPNDLDQLECLEKLELWSGKIRHIPNCIFMLKHLKSLKLVTFWQTFELPEDLAQLECLENLSLVYMSLIGLPDSICKLKKLKYLKVKCCMNFEKLPEELGCLECLRELNLKDTPISHLPQSISMLKGLLVVGSRSLLQSCDFTSNIQISEKHGTFCYI